MGGHDDGYKTKPEVRTPTLAMGLFGAAVGAFVGGVAVVTAPAWIGTALGISAIGPVAGGTFAGVQAASCGGAIAAGGAAASAQSVAMGGVTAAAAYKGAVTGA